MIHKKGGFSKGFRERLLYIFRGDNHKHRLDNECVELIVNHNMYSSPKLEKSGNVNIDDVDSELSILSSMNQRANLKHKCAHYIISLPPGERLDASDWEYVAYEYMCDLGYDLSHSKFVVARHSSKVNGSDKHVNDHIHICASRVLDKSGYPVVSDSNDYENGISTMRRMEKHFGLSGTEPQNHNIVPKQSSLSNEKALLRKKLKSIIDKKSNLNLQSFQEQLAIRNIDIKYKINELNEVVGILYKNSQSKNWYSGSQLSKNLLTVNKLKERHVLETSKMDSHPPNNKYKITNKDEYTFKNKKFMVQMFPKNTDELLKNYSVYRSNKYKGVFVLFDIFLEPPPRSKVIGLTAMERYQKMQSIIMEEAMRLVQKLIEYLFCSIEFKLRAIRDNEVIDSTLISGFPRRDFKKYVRISNPQNIYGSSVSR